MPPKAGHSMKNATNAKHTKIMKKWPPHKNARVSLVEFSHATTNVNIVRQLKNLAKTRA
jgi:hypothetical protein